MMHNIYPIIILLAAISPLHYSQDSEDKISSENKAIENKAIENKAIEPKPIVTRSFKSSFELFKNICFKTLPYSESFFEAKEASNSIWKKRRKSRDSGLGLGDSWRSKQGILSYQYLPSGVFSVTDPVCDLEFNADDDYNHGFAIQEISTYLLLKSKNTSDKYATKACWQGTLDDGRHVRFRLESDYYVSGVKKAKLSIAYIKKFPLKLESNLRKSGALRCK